MLISGVQPFTMLDYPGKTATIVFTAGCNFRCGYCHNPEFVLPELLAKLKGDFITEEAFFNFLEERVGLLEGVVVSGGEPTIHAGIIDFIAKIKQLGFFVKLDTNGNKPEVVRELLRKEVVDYIALDYKTSAKNYSALAGALAFGEKVQETLALIKQSGIDYELRITLVKELHTPETLAEMAREMTGAKRVFLQQFRSATTLNLQFADYKAFSTDEMLAIAEQFRRTVKEVAVRS